MAYFSGAGGFMAGLRQAALDGNEHERVSFERRLMPGRERALTLSNEATEQGIAHRAALHPEALRSAQLGNEATGQAIQHRGDLHPYALEGAGLANAGARQGLEFNEQANPYRLNQMYHAARQTGADADVAERTVGTRVAQAGAALEQTKAQTAATRVGTASAQAQLDAFNQERPVREKMVGQKLRQLERGELYGQALDGINAFTRTGDTRHIKEIFDRFPNGADDNIVELVGNDQSGYRLVVAEREGDPDPYVIEARTPAELMERLTGDLRAMHNPEAVEQARLNAAASEREKAVEYNLKAALEWQKAYAKAATEGGGLKQEQAMLKSMSDIAKQFKDTGASDALVNILQTEKPDGPRIIEEMARIAADPSAPKEQRGLAARYIELANEVGGAALPPPSAALPPSGEFYVGQGGNIYTSGQGGLRRIDAGAHGTPALRTDGMR